MQIRHGVGGTTKYLDNIPVELRGFVLGGTPLRSADQALDVARAAGIRGLEKFQFEFLPDSELDDMLRHAGHTNTQGVLAHFGPMRSVREGQFMPFIGTYQHSITGRIPVLVKESVLTSDEAIVFVIRHEIHEVARLRGAWRFGTDRLQLQRGLRAEKIPGLVEEAHQSANYFGGKRVLNVRSKP